VALRPAVWPCQLVGRSPSAGSQVLPALPLCVLLARAGTRTAVTRERVTALGFWPSPGSLDLRPVHRVISLVLNSIAPSRGELRLWVPVTCAMLGPSLMVALTASH
jgi:hypothetical protein